MVPIGRRHPGIDLAYPAMSNYAAADGIKCVNWLAFLSPGQCEQLGGVAKLTKALGSEIEVHRLPNGVMIQAGSRPELGDVNRRQNVPLYHRVGRVLAPIRSKNHPAYLGRGGEPSEERRDDQRRPDEHRDEHRGERPRALLCHATRPPVTAGRTARSTAVAAPRPASRAPCASPSELRRACCHRHAAGSTESARRSRRAQPSPRRGRRRALSRKRSA